MELLDGNFPYFAGAYLVVVVLLFGYIQYLHGQINSLRKEVQNEMKSNDTQPPRRQEASDENEEPQSEDTN